MRLDCSGFQRWSGNLTGWPRYPTNRKQAMGKAKPKSWIVGRWLIESMEQWDREFIDEEVRGYFEFDVRDSGAFQFGCVQGQIVGFGESPHAEAQAATPRARSRRTRIDERNCTARCASCWTRTGRPARLPFRPTATSCGRSCRSCRFSPTARESCTCRQRIARPRTAKFTPRPGPLPAFRAI